MESEKLFEIIETKNKVHTCVIDYVSKRQVMVYDLTNTDDTIFRLMVVKWKLYHFDMRFSIFKAIYYPTVDIPPVTVINRRAIVYCSAELKLTKPKRSKVRINLELDTGDD